MRPVKSSYLTRKVTDVPGVPPARPMVSCQSGVFSWTQFLWVTRKGLVCRWKG